jgi:hypothetical protein
MGWHRTRWLGQVLKGIKKRKERKHCGREEETGNFPSIILHTTERIAGAGTETDFAIRCNALAVSLTSFLTDGVLEAYASLRTFVLRPRVCWTCSRTWGTHKPVLLTWPFHPSQNKININYRVYTWWKQLKWITLYEGSTTHYAKITSFHILTNSLSTDLIIQCHTKSFKTFLELVH